MRDAIIHLRVPASLEARRVRLSRAQGQRLTDWLIERVERRQDLKPVMARRKGRGDVRFSAY